MKSNILVRVEGLGSFLRVGDCLNVVSDISTTGKISFGGGLGGVGVVSCEDGVIGHEVEGDRGGFWAGAGRSGVDDELTGHICGR